MKETFSEVPSSTQTALQQCSLQGAKVGNEKKKIASVGCRKRTRKHFKSF